MTVDDVTRHIWRIKRSIKYNFFHSEKHKITIVYLYFVILLVLPEPLQSFSLNFDNFITVLFRMQS